MLKIHIIFKQSILREYNLVCEYSNALSTRSLISFLDMIIKLNGNDDFINL